MRLSLIESKTFRRPCYGFYRDNEGYIHIAEDKAENIRLIFNLIRQGYTLQDVQDKLYEEKILSPSGKEIWTRDVIHKTINNAKYMIFHMVDEDIYFKARNVVISHCRNDNRK